MKRALLFSFSSACVVFAQLVPPNQIPASTGKPPVIFLNGYQQICSSPAAPAASFSSSFGIADQVLQADGRPAVFFDNCAFRRVSIEALGNEFRDFLEKLTYIGGGKVDQVDVVAHSLGGLILRSYLSGKQLDGSYTPPANTKIRKAILIGVPHAGSNLAMLGGSDIQLTQLAVASQFVFDLATWNQNTEDLRGVDAVAILGDAGNGGFGGGPKFSDGVVSLTSGSLEAWLPGRTRILPGYCHISGGLASLICNPSDKGIADITSDAHPSARIVISFLNGTEAWRSEGLPPAQNALLAGSSGLMLQWRDKGDQILKVGSAEISGVGNMSVRGETITYRDQVPARPLQITAALAGNTSVSTSLTPVTAGTTALIAKAGPIIAAVLPSAQAVTPRAVAPGMFTSLYGVSLATSTEQASGAEYPNSLGDTRVRIGTRDVPMQYASPQQLNVVMPDDIAGLVRLTVLNASGQQTVNVVVEPAVPALFAPAINATTGQLVTSGAPLRPGDYVSLFLTGLGRTETRQDGLQWAVQAPEVTVGGKPCGVTYAGRAPGFTGLDQINCALAADVPANPSSPIVVRSGSRVTTSSLPIQ